MMEACRLYQKDWKKTEHNSFPPDLYTFKLMNMRNITPYLLLASESLKVKVRTVKLQKIKEKING
jgi:hypothetical protein